MLVFVQAEFFDVLVVVGFLFGDEGINEFLDLVLECEFYVGLSFVSFLVDICAVY